MGVEILLLAAAAGAVCADPAKPCAGFRAHDLSFVRDARAVAKAEESSTPFYAVILKSAAKCAIGEDERVRIQALFPGRKVFSARFECDGDVENNVRYTNVDASRGFIAVHAGASAGDAAKVVAEAKSKGFADANARRMQAVFVHP